ncbi:FecR family protein [Pedobacter heparinus]|uniref:FecR family protein n=1 Tax=Pedobacter heparinus TaxID=984 RepID=UPI00292EA0CD|nr:FecR family protein [Pedobacter heparinus]
MNKQYFLDLLAKSWSGEISSAENLQLQEAMEQDEELRQIAHELEAYFQSKKDNANSRNAAEKLQRVWKTIALAGQQNFVPKYNHTEPVKSGFSRAYLLKIAAVFLVTLCCAVITFNYWNREKTVKFDTLNTTIDKLYKTLDDGTKVCLNRGSSIRFNSNFGADKREIFLEGEAFFDVAKNKEIPLYIHARNLNIEVKGTAFNVNAYREKPNIEVSLFRGLVEITSNLDKGDRLLLKPNEKLIAAAQDGGSGMAFMVLPMATARQLQEINWTQDSLVFKKEKLKDLVIRLEKKYVIKIDIQKEELKDKRFSGSFAAEGLKEALEALKLSYPFTYTINNKLVIIK